MAFQRWLSPQAAKLISLIGVNDPVCAMQGLAKRLIDEAAFDRPPFDPRILGSLRNVLSVKPTSMVGAARLVPDGRALLIEVNQDHSLGKQNFSIDHEVSHTLMPGYANAAVNDFETGTFSSNQEEEYFCDVGAAALLLDPRWLGPLASEGGPALETLEHLAMTFASSLESTARQMTALNLWPHAFVFWEEGLRKEQRVAVNQLRIPNLSGLSAPALKMRVAKAYSSPSFTSLVCFIPPNKSVPDASLVAICCGSEPHTYGTEFFDFGKSNGTFLLHFQNWHAPYRKGKELHRRVISLLQPVNAQSTILKPATGNLLESL